MENKEKEYDSEAVVHHVHYNKSIEGLKREVSINGSVYSISLSSDDSKENIDFLLKRSKETLKEFIKEGK